MERLTKSGAVSQKDINKLMELSNENQFGVNNAYYKLKEYEDLEEQGLLLRLPCPIGTTVYVIVEEWEEIYDSNSMYYDIYEEAFHPYMIDGVGKEIFLTYEEAEQKLEEMKNN